VVLLMAMGASRGDAEDAVQEAMILALRRWDTIEEPASWVRTVAARKYWRLAKSRQPTVLLDEVMAEPSDDRDLGIFAEEQQHVLRLLRGLPERQRIVVALYYDGLTTTEIAELTGTSAATVRSNLRHARTALRELVHRELL
jgi:RNA polymerase sigma-70 factor (ECF subfamily)